MYKNVYIDSRKNKVYLWEQFGGKNVYDSITWVPYVFVPDDTGIVKSLDGVPVKKKEFTDHQQYQAYQKENKSNIYENHMDKGIQFLCERYSGIPDEEMEIPMLKVYSIDIETNDNDGTHKGFPHVKDALHNVVLINVRQLGKSTNKIIKTWGIKPYTGENPEGVDYYHCRNEEELLTVFFNWWNKNSPDVVTGWNISAENKTNARGGFDIPYLINRCKVLYGENTDLYKKLSPINVVRSWVKEDTGAMYVSIAGVSILDYMSLYKWYTSENSENFKLETISSFELGHGKLDYSEFGSLRELFYKDWNRYVDYNALDNRLIDELEEKLGYIRLAQNLALVCKCEMESYTSTTTLIEGLMLAHYRRNGMCAPRLVGGEQTWFPAAYVKDPEIGRHEWVVDLDIASSYPTAIITLNMSPETYYGRCIEYYNEDTMRWTHTINGREGLEPHEVAVREDPVCQFVRRREFPAFKLLKETGISVIVGKKLDTFNTALKKGLITVAPCGSMFLTNKKGQMAIVEKQLFEKRVVFKNNMKKVKKAAEVETNEDLKKELSAKGENLFATQLAIKILLNSMYGTFSSGFSRYANVHIGEAITSCGRRAVLKGAEYVEYFLNNPNDKLKQIIDNIKNEKNKS